jgi:transcriptional regulator with XRE-family HTH domain
MLRQWRRQRRWSQLALAAEAEVSARHLSFIESGRARPSREMVLRLADALELPLRERNALLTAAGFTPAFPDRGADDPAIAEQHAAIQRILDGHMPYPALALDRFWNVQRSNAAVRALLGRLLPPQRLAAGAPVNMLELSLSPEGLAPYIVDLAEWRAQLLARVRRHALVAGDGELLALWRRLSALPVPAEPAARSSVGMPSVDAAALAVPLRLRLGDRVLAFQTATLVFGTPTDVSLSELMLELLFPADAATSQHLQALAAA